MDATVIQPPQVPPCSPRTPQSHITQPTLLVLDVAVTDPSQLPLCYYKYIGVWGELLSTQGWYLLEEWSEMYNFTDPPQNSLWIWISTAFSDQKNIHHRLNQIPQPGDPTVHLKIPDLHCPTMVT